MEREANIPPTQAVGHAQAGCKNHPGHLGTQVAGHSGHHPGPRGSRLVRALAPTGAVGCNCGGKKVEGEARRDTKGAIGGEKVEEVREFEEEEEGAENCSAGGE